MAHISLTQGTPAARTEVWIESGSLDRIGGLLAGLKGPKTSGVLITDSNVGPLHGERVLQSLRDAGLAFELATIRPGEESKSLPVVQTLYEIFSKHSLSRDSIVVALGGGVVGDVAGFAAGTWMRGIRWVICPTTLAAAVDSAIGGKTGVNFGGVKNLIGVFLPPSAVVVDPDCLKTLPDRELRAGLAECVKHALLTSAAEVGWLEANVAAIGAGESGVMAELIERNLRIKGRIVEADPREQTGARVMLNLGHTIGHAIEGAAAGELRHGECVALGLVAASRISQRAGLLGADVASRIETLLAALELPVRLSLSLDQKTVMSALRLDKKRSGRGLRFVLLEGIGKPITRDDIPLEWAIDSFESLKSNG